MTESDILQKLTEIFRDVLDLPHLVLETSTTAEDVSEWNSVNHITLVVAAEQAFGVKFQTSELEELKNVGELAHLIEAKLKSG